MIYRPSSLKMVEVDDGNEGKARKIAKGGNEDENII